VQDPWWTTVLGAKDLALAIQVAREAGVTLPAGEVVHQLYDRAIRSGYDDADISAVSALYRAYSYRRATTGVRAAARLAG